MDYEGATGTLERPEDIQTSPAGVVKRWLLEIKLADKRESDWRKKSEAIWKRYRQKDAKRHSFNILWSNTETLSPAVYNSLPKPDVRRRFKDADPVGKAVSEVLYRSLEYGLDVTDFHSSIKACVLDMLLPGRGVGRVRYVPSLQQVGVTPETHEEANEQHESGGEALEGEETEELAWEQAPFEHTQWDDFRILCAAKEWCEVSAIGFRHRMTRDALEEKFGQIGARVQLDVADDDEIKSESDDSVKDAFKTAEVWEIWDKDNRKVLFISKGYKESPLMEVDDPLNLIDFFPIPRPLYAIEDSSSLVPVPFYELYKEQADELDAITKRINTLVKGLKLRGVYDSTLTELSELMRGEDNDLIPASGVTALLERGGLEKAIWFMPIEQAAMVLKELYVQREQVKAVIYEITGISDILRGSTNASETATAQQIKANWGSNRLKRLQAEVARFIRDILRLQSEIIGEKFQLETLQTMTGIKLPSLQEKQQAMQAQQQGQQVPPELMTTPAWEEVLQVLRDDKLRTFKVDVETDSTISASIEGDMDALQKLLSGITQLVQGLGPAVQMGAMPIDALKELILAVTRRAKLGNAVEDALDKIKQPNPPADPNQAEQAKVQAEQQQKQAEMQQQMQIESMRMQMEERQRQAELRAEMQLESFREQMVAEREERQAERESLLRQQEFLQDQAFERFKALLDAKTKVEVAEIGANATLSAAQMSAAEQSETEEEGE